MQAKPWLLQATKTEKPTSVPRVTPITQENDIISGKIFRMNGRHRTLKQTRVSPLYSFADARFS